MGGRRRRFLFVVPPGAGHVNSVRGVVAELAARGHRVAWLGERSLRPHLPKRARLFVPPAEAYANVRAIMSGQARSGRPLWLELGDGAIAAVEAMFDEFRPDALVIDRLLRIGDHLPIGATIAARRRGLPWATTTTGGGSPITSLDPDLPSPPHPELAELQQESGLDPIDWPLASPGLVLVFSTPELVGGRIELPAHYTFVGPAFGPREETTPFPWKLLRPGPHVLASLGTVYAGRGERFYGALVEGLSGSKAQVILAAPPHLVPTGAANVLVRPFVPQLAVLPHVDAVVSHGGHNTVSETLAQGLPLVLAPIIDDQPVIADQVAAAGAGIVVSFADASPGELAGAVAAVLGEPGYRAAAARLATSFPHDGPGLAADALEHLVT